MLFLKLHKNNELHTVAIAGRCRSAKLNLFEELTGTFVCEMPETELKGIFYYKYNQYIVTYLSEDCLADSSAEYECVIYVINACRLERELVDALRFSRQAERFVVLICHSDKKYRPPLNVKLLSGVLGAQAVFQTRCSSKGVNKLLDAIGKGF